MDLDDRIAAQRERLEARKREESLRQDRVPKRVPGGAPFPQEPARIQAAVKAKRTDIERLAADVPRLRPVELSLADIRGSKKDGHSSDNAHPSNGSSMRASEIFGAFKLAVVWAVMCAAPAVAIYYFYATTVDVAPAPLEWWPMVAVLAALPGMIIGWHFGSSPYRSRAEAQRAARDQRREQAERTRKLSEERTLNEKRQLLDRLAQAPHEALFLYSNSLEWLDAAAGWLADAKVHRRNNAMTPFWEALETSAEQLNGFGQAIGRLSAVTAGYGNAIRVLDPQELRKGFDGGVPVIPDAIDQTLVAQGAIAVAKGLRDVMYEAQRDFHFASIYEQRRTTSAVVAGFASLREAVDGLSGVVGARTEELAVAIAGVEREMVSASREWSSGAGIFASPDSVGGQLRNINETLGRLEGR